MIGSAETDLLCNQTDVVFYSSYCKKIKFNGITFIHYFGFLIFKRIFYLDHEICIENNQNSCVRYKEPKPVNMHQFSELSVCVRIENNKCFYNYKIFNHVLPKYFYQKMLPEVLITKSHISSGIFYDQKNNYYEVSLKFKSSFYTRFIEHTTALVIILVIGLASFLIKIIWTFLRNLYRNIANYRLFVRVATQVRMPKFDITLNYSANNIDIVNEIGEFFQKYRFHVTNQDNEMKIKR